MPSMLSSKDVETWPQEILSLASAQRVEVILPALSLLRHIRMLCQVCVFFFNQTKKEKEKKISISVLWFPHSVNEIFYGALNLVVIVPLPVETTEKTPFHPRQHVPPAPSGPIAQVPPPPTPSREERPLLRLADDSHRSLGARRR